MERQKIFWVVLSVSVFVVVVLVVGVFLLRQKPQASFASATPTVTPLADPGTQVYEYQASPGAAASSPATGDQAGGNTETMHFYIGEGASKGGTGQPGASSPSGSAAPGTQQPAGSPAVTAPSAGTAPVTPAAPAAAAPAPTGRVVPGLGAPAVAKAAPVKPAARVPQYWIQTGSYKSQTKAEDLASLLGDKGLSGRVFSYASQGSTWYRVRVGPYTSKGEADKFLAEVQKLQGLGASFISQVAPTKVPLN